MHRKFALPPLVLSLLAISLLPSAAAASPAAPVVHDTDGATAHSASRYWTPKRMRAARELRVSRRAGARALRAP